MAIPKQTVIIAEDDPVTFDSLERLLSQAKLKVVRYENGHTLRQAGYLNGTPCVLILGDVAGLEFLDFLKKARWAMPVIFVHSGNSISEAVKAIQSGAEDYISKPFRSDALLNSVKRAMQKAAQQAELTANITDLARRADSLTTREREIIKLVLSGLLNKQIAERLGLALVTIKVHRGSAMRKLGARTAAELARLTQDAGFIRSEILFSPNGKTTLSAPLSGPTSKNQGVTARK